MFYSTKTKLNLRDKRTIQLPSRNGMASQSGFRNKKQSNGISNVTAYSGFADHYEKVENELSPKNTSYLNKTILKNHPEAEKAVISVYFQ